MMLPNGWKKVKLGQIMSFKNGLNFSQVSNGKELNFLGVANFKSRKFISSETQLDKIYLADFPNDDYLLKANDLVFVRSNGSKDLVGRCVKMNNSFSKTTFSGFCIRGRLFSSETTADYILHFIESGFLKDKLRRESRGTNISNLNQDILDNFDIMLPPLEEQKKIAATLSVWDSAIEKMEKLIEAKESQKKSLITKLIVFSDDKNISELTKIKLSDIFDEVCEKNRPDEDVLTIIQGVGTVLRTDSGREIIYDKNSLSNYKYVKKGDFIIHLRSFESGLEVANQDGIVSPAYIILRPKIKVSTVYLYSLFHTNEFINRTIAPAVEGARDGRSVKYDVLKNQTITLPNLSEQQSVAELFLEADNEISLLKQQFENYKMQKQGLMQKLLTGQWRVK